MTLRLTLITLIAGLTIGSGTIASLGCGGGGGGTPVAEEAAEAPAAGEAAENAGDGAGDAAEDAADAGAAAGDASATGGDSSVTTPAATTTAVVPNGPPATPFAAGTPPGTPIGTPGIPDAPGVIPVYPTAAITGIAPAAELAPGTITASASTSTNADSMNWVLTQEGSAPPTSTSGPTFTADLAAGNYTLVLSVASSTGHKDDAEILFQIAGPPTLTLTSDLPANGNWPKDNPLAVTIALNPTSAGTATEYAVHLTRDNQQVLNRTLAFNTTTANVVSIPTATEGLYSLTVTGSGIGGTSETPVVLEFQVLDAPTLEAVMSGISDTKYFAKDAVLTLEASEAHDTPSTTFTWQIYKGVDPFTCSGETTDVKISCTLEPGTFRVILQAHLAIGTTTISSVPHQAAFVVLDTPSVHITGIPEHQSFPLTDPVSVSVDGTDLGDSVTIDWTLTNAQGQAVKTLHKSGAPSTLGFLQFSEMLSQSGTYTLSVEMVNAVGLGAFTEKTIFVYGNPTPLIKATSLSHRRSYSPGGFFARASADNTESTAWVWTLIKDGDVANPVWEVHGQDASIDLNQTEPGGTTPFGRYRLRLRATNPAFPAGRHTELRFNIRAEKQLAQITDGWGDAPLKNIFAFNEADVYFSTTEGLYHRGADERIVKLLTTDPADDQTTITAIWGLHTNLVFAASRSTLYRYTAAKAWEAMPIKPSEVPLVTSQSISNKTQQLIGKKYGGTLYLYLRTSGENSNLLYYSTNMGDSWSEAPQTMAGLQYVKVLEGGRTAASPLLFAGGTDGGATGRKIILFHADPEHTFQDNAKFVQLIDDSKTAHDIMSIHALREDRVVFTAYSGEVYVYNNTGVHLAGTLPKAPFNGTWPQYGLEHYNFRNQDSYIVTQLGGIYSVSYNSPENSLTEVKAPVAAASKRLAHAHAYTTDKVVAFDKSNSLVYLHITDSNGTPSYAWEAVENATLDLATPIVSGLASARDGTLLTNVTNGGSTDRLQMLLDTGPLRSAPLTGGTLKNQTLTFGDTGALPSGHEFAFTSIGNNPATQQSYIISHAFQVDPDNPTPPTSELPIEASTFLPAGEFLIAIETGPSEPKHYYILSSKHLYETTNGGPTVTPVQDGPAISGNTPKQFLALWTSPLGDLVAGTSDGTLHWKRHDDTEWSTAQIPLPPSGIGQIQGIVGSDDGELIFAYTPSAIYRLMENAWQAVPLVDQNGAVLSVTTTTNAIYFADLDATAVPGGAFITLLTTDNKAYRLAPDGFHELGNISGVMPLPTETFLRAHHTPSTILALTQEPPAGGANTSKVRLYQFGPMQ
jgi:hypothetical protein